jgi:V8-like Glu-specific endopeptidase
MIIDLQQVQAATRRFKAREAQRTRNERLIQEGRFLDIDSPQRVHWWLDRRVGSVTGEDFFAAPGGPAAQETATLESRARSMPPDALERMLGNNDLIGVAFLERGLQVARTVGRVWVDTAGGKPRGYGTGFLISPQLLITNHHVLPDSSVAGRSCVEFDYQLSMSGSPCPTCTFGFDPGTFYYADKNLDYAVVAVAPKGTDDRALASFGWNALIEDQGKVIISQWMNIVQHPNGEMKQLSVRENQLVDVLDDFLQYRTDTAPGSSGSPVLNDRWEVVGLHHSGVWETNAAGQVLAIDGSVWTEEMGEHRIKWRANEGVRISRIIADLRGRLKTPDERQMFDQVFVGPSAQELLPSRRSPRPTQTTEVECGTDGTATWTIPLSVTVRVGGCPPPGGPVSAGPAAPPVSPAAPASVAPAPPPDGDLDAAVEAVRRQLAGRDDVLEVKPGYLFRDGWITRERAIVVTVRRKQDPAALRESAVTPLPEMLGGFPVEVTSPSVADLVRISRGAPAAEAVFAAPTVLREEITYTRPAGVSLEKVTDRMRVVAHVSPDAGWPQLSEFLGQTRQRLVIGIYDFGAPHVVKAVEAIAGKPRFQKLTLVMQRGESVGHGTKADDLTDQEVVTKLAAAFGNRFENAWVKMGAVSGWVSSSYHIKVVVRDQKAFWLSSGNLQSSNLPGAAPLSEQPPRLKWLTEYNREWHAIVEHEGLARTYEACLLHDFANNAATPQESLVLPDILVPEAFWAPSPLERTEEVRYFAPFDQTRDFTVTPLLTPDNYHEQVLELINGAQETLLIQNQTFKAPGMGHAKLRELVEAVKRRQQAGVDVRVIFRVLFPKDARDVLTGLQEFGFPTGIIRVQPNCHTKGIIVDHRRVLLGSQNWSNDGVSVNRDASLLFDDEELARYFEEIFEYDWKTRARQDIGTEALPIEVAAAGNDQPAGMVRLTWKDYMEMQ